ncbi:hypothetical protein JMA_36520 [Jeotgalibacillus malaysiensis]|uniref:Uncharacterized protein n=1 Tax=Jeotgalibacillus malaysiensis TaxID=1508404 RepID=A0A0B5AYA3_9BACL|nr:hypothetical protein [Jeotgalibacillus malaysiensis]AJD92969.1 hypothetical protein JMA_36520 [Jeotgalibacillus malaysiensis]
MKKTLDFVLIAGAIAILLFASFERYINPWFTIIWISIAISLLVLSNMKNPQMKKPFVIILLIMTLSTLAFISWAPLNFELLIHVVFALSPLVPIINMLNQTKSPAYKSDTTITAGDSV